MDELQQRITILSYAQEYNLPENEIFPIDANDKLTKNLNPVNFQLASDYISRDDMIFDTWIEESEVSDFSRDDKEFLYFLVKTRYLKIPEKTVFDEIKNSLSSTRFTYNTFTANFRNWFSNRNDRIKRAVFDLEKLSSLEKGDFADYLAIDVSSFIVASLKQAYTITSRLEENIRLLNGKSLFDNSILSWEVPYIKFHTGNGYIKYFVGNGNKLLKYHNYIIPTGIKQKNPEELWLSVATKTEKDTVPRIIYPHNNKSNMKIIQEDYKIYSDTYETVVISNRNAFIPSNISGKSLEIVLSNLEKALPSLIVTSTNVKRVSGRMNFYNIIIYEAMFLHIIANDPIIRKNIYFRVETNKNHNEAYANRFRFIIRLHRWEGDFYSNVLPESQASVTLKQHRIQAQRETINVRVYDEETGQPQQMDKDYKKGVFFVSAKFKGATQNACIEFGYLLSKIFTRYLEIVESDEFAPIKAFYEEISKGSSTRTIKFDIKSLKEDSSSKLRKKIIPEFYGVDSSRLECQSAQQPTPFYFDEKDKAMEAAAKPFFNKNTGQYQTRQIMVYPPDHENPRRQFYFVCEKDTNTYPGVTTKGNESTSQYDYVPCCFRVDQIGDTARGKSYYHEYYHGIEKKRKERDTTITTTKVIGKIDREGDLPSGTVDVLVLMILSKKERKIAEKLKSLADSGIVVRRIGIPVGTNSLIHCVLRAVEDPEYMKSSDVESREEYARSIRQDLLSRNINPNIAKQQLFDSTEDEIAEKIRDNDVDFEPAELYRVLELYFNINIFVIETSGDNRKDDTGFQQPRYKDFRVSTFEPKNKTIIIHNTLGTSVDKLPFRHNELIVQVRKDGSFKTTWESDMGTFLNEVMINSIVLRTITRVETNMTSIEKDLEIANAIEEHVSGSGSSGNSTSSDIQEAKSKKEKTSLPKAIKKKSDKISKLIFRSNSKYVQSNLIKKLLETGVKLMNQYIDPHGKLRMISVSYHKFRFSMFVEPDAPLNCTTSTYYYYCDAKTLFELLPELESRITGKTVNEGGSVEAIWFSSNTSKFAICIPIKSSSIDAGRITTIAPAIPNYNFGVSYYNSNSISTLVDRTRTLKRIFETFFQLVIWCFVCSKLNNVNDFKRKYTVVRREEETDSLKLYSFEKIIERLKEENIELPIHDKIESCFEFLIEYVNSIVKNIDGKYKLFFYDERLRDGMLDGISRIPYSLKINTKPLRLKIITEYETDFKSRESERIFLTENDFREWINNTNVKEGDMSIAVRTQIRSLDCVDKYCKEPYVYRNGIRLYLVQEAKRDKYARQRAVLMAHYWRLYLKNQYYDLNVVDVENDELDQLEEDVVEYGRDETNFFLIKNVAKNKTNYIEIVNLYPVADRNETDYAALLPLN